MAAAQYQIPGGGFINEQEDGTEYMLPGVGYFNEPPAPVGGGFIASWASQRSKTIGAGVM